MQEYKRKLNLTPKQIQLFRFVEDYIERHDFAPSYEEIMEALDIKSKSVVNNRVVALKERGWIDFEPNKWRSITILD